MLRRPGLLVVGDIAADVSSWSFCRCNDDFVCRGGGQGLGALAGRCLLLWSRSESELSSDEW